MRVCLLTRSLYPVIGGSETYVYQLGKALQRMGHEVTVVTSDLNGHEDASHQYPFSVRRVPGLSAFNSAAAPLNTLVPLCEALRSVAPDVIHAQNVLLGVAVTLLSDALPRDCGVVFTDHNTAIPTERRWISGLSCYDVELALGRFQFQRGSYDVAVAPSQAFFEWALACGAPSERLVLVRHAVDTTFFSPGPVPPRIRQQLCADPRAFLVLAPGRMLRRKGILGLLDALCHPLLVDRNVHLALTTTTNTSEPDFLALVAGEIEAKGLQRRVSLSIDVFAPEQMPEVYRASDCVAFLSRAEGFGLVGIEALACGVPVVARRSAGIDEYLQHGHTGLFVENDSAQDVAVSISRVIDDSELRRCLVQNGRELVVRDFDLAVMARSLERVYARAIESRRAQPGAESPRSSRRDEASSQAGR